MQFTIAKDKLSYLLYLTSTIVEKKNTMPILSNVRLTADKGLLTVAATDLEVSLLGEAEAEVKTPGSITVGAKVFYDVVKELPEQQVSIAVAKGQRLEIQSGQSRFRMNGVSAEEYPSINGTNLVSPVAVEAKKVYEMLVKTAFAISHDEARYNINGVYVETLDARVAGDKTTIRMVATDGHRLAMIDRPAEGMTLATGVILPQKGIQELKKVLEDNSGAAQVSIHEGFLTVQSGRVTLGVRLVDGQFPDYRQVIPVESNSRVEISREEFLSGVRRVSLVTTDKSRAIKFKLLDGNLLISSSSPEFGEASDTLAVKQEGENVTIGFSARYVLDLLGAMEESETVQIKFNGDLGPAIFSGTNDDHYNGIIMPMRFD